MGRGPGSVICDNSGNSTCLHRQKDAAANVGDIWRNGGADGCHRCRRVVGLSNACVVDLSALVFANPVVVDMLGSVSITVYVEKDDAACRYSDVGGQHSGWRQYDAISTNQCLYDGLFGADGLSDGFDDSDNGELPA